MAPLPMDYAPLARRIREALPETVAVYVHGSRAGSRERPGSDLDLALLFPPDRVPRARELLDLRGELEALARCAVDLSVLDLRASAVFCKEVVAQGRLLYESDPRQRADFETRTFSEYARLCEDRAPVVKAYSAGRENA